MGTRVNGLDLDAGTSVTISTATPQPLGTAAAGSTGEVSDAGHVHDAPAAASAITTYDLSSSSGWTTDAGTGSASVNTAAESADLGVPSGTAATGNSVPTISRPHGIAGDWELRARLVELSGSAGGAPRALLEVMSAATGETGVQGVMAWIGNTGSVELLTRESGGTTSRGNVACSLPLAGTGWVRLRYRDGRITVSIGTGVGTAAPTQWQKTHDFSWETWASPIPVLTHLRVRALHFGTGSSTALVVRWDSLRTVALEPT